MLNRSASLATSTGLLKALPGKLDINRHSPSILYVFHGLTHIYTFSLLLLETLFQKKYLRQHIGIMVFILLQRLSMDVDEDSRPKL